MKTIISTFAALFAAATFAGTAVGVNTSSVGKNAGDASKNVDYSVAHGVYAGYGATNVLNAVLIGMGAGIQAKGLTNVVAIGTAALAGANHVTNAVIIGNEIYVRPDCFRIGPMSCTNGVVRVNGAQIGGEGLEAVLSHGASNTAYSVYLLSPLTQISTLYVRDNSAMSAGSGTNYRMDGITLDSSVSTNGVAMTYYFPGTSMGATMDPWQVIATKADVQGGGGSSGSGSVTMSYDSASSTIRFYDSGYEFGYITYTPSSGGGQTYIP